MLKLFARERGRRLLFARERGRRLLFVMALYFGAPYTSVVPFVSTPLLPR